MLYYGNIFCCLFDLYATKKTVVEPIIQFSSQSDTVQANTSLIIWGIAIKVCVYNVIVFLRFQNMISSGQ